MADSSTHPASHRDSVNETSPLLPGDAQAQAAATSTRGPAEPSALDPPNQPTPARITIRGAIIASRVLLAASATSLLLGVVLYVTYLTKNDDSKLPWGWANYLGLLGFLSFLCIFLSVVNLVLLTQARRRNETIPPGLGILINTAAHGFLTFCLILTTSYIIDERRWGDGVRNDAFEALLLLWLAVGVILGWMVMPALVIFWLRGLIIWIRNTGPSITWSLPGGQLTVEASIKFHRQEPLRESRESA